MADGIYIGMAGAVARSEQLDSIADNLANAQTPGYKAARPAFQTFLPVSGAPDKAYPAAVATGFDLAPGMLVQTGAPLDITPEGDAFIAVRTPANTVAFTRNGRLQIGADGVLRSGDNLVLQPNGETIAFLPEAKPRLDANGAFWVDDAPAGQIAFAKLEGTLLRTGATLLAPAEAGSATPVETQVRLGVVEQGNATALESAVALVSAQRNYETSMQAIQTYRRLDERASEVGRIR